MSTKKFCYTIIETQTDERGHFIPSAVIEGESGNAKMGLSKGEAAIMVAALMR